MNYPTLLLDSAHNHASGKDHQPSTYRIDNSAGLILDPSGYQFSDYTPINSIQVVLGEQAIYMANWDGLSPIVLDSNNLQRLRANADFTGFPAGQKAIIAIGGAKEEPHSNKLQFVVGYILMLDVS